MPKLRSMARLGAVLFALVHVTNALAQDPVHGEILAPRNDLVTMYSDAFLSPEACAPMDYHSAEQSVDQLLRAPRHWRYYGGADGLIYTRTRPENKNTVLVRTSFNLFDGTPAQLRVGATPATPLFPANTSTSPNDPTLRLNVPLTEFLIPGAIRMQTDQFETDWEAGTRARFGIEFANGDKFEMSYFWLDQFTARLIDDVSGSAFFTTQISNPAAAYFQRFGYLNSFFRTPDPRFFGESRRALALNSLDPHNPFNENPAPPPTVLPVTINPLGARSTDVPREPTNADFPLLPNSLLWTDGELAIADYDFDLQGGEGVYKRRIFDYTSGNWQVYLLGGIRFLSLDESFGFLFADTTYDRAAANPNARNVIVPPPPNAGNIPIPGGPQSAGEVTAIYQTGIKNDMLGPQIGLEAQVPFLYFFEFDMLGKAGFLFNFLENRQALMRGDGLVAYDISKEVTATSGAFEGHLGANAYLLPSLKLRGGFEFLWLINVGTGIEQIEFNLHRFPRPKNDSSVLFHGFYAGAELTF